MTTAILTYHHAGRTRKRGPTIDVPCRLTPSRVIIEKNDSLGDSRKDSRVVYRLWASPQMPIQFCRTTHKAVGPQSTNWVMESYKIDADDEVTPDDQEEGEE
jgi:hypothetical protein